MTVKPLSIKDIPLQIVYDFEQFMNYVDRYEVPLSKKLEYIQKKHLYNLNQLMSDPEEGVTLYTDQPSYPLLHLFYHLALNSRLLTKQFYKAGQFQLSVTERFTEYNELNDVEKYFFLLETFWVDSDWMNLNSNERMISKIPYVLLYFAKQKPNQETLLEESGLHSFMYEWNYFLNYFSYFGFWTFLPDESSQQYSKKWMIAKTITPTRFGILMFQTLIATRRFTEWNIPSRKIGGEFNPIPGTIPEKDNILWDIEDRVYEEYGVVSYENEKGEPFYLKFKGMFEKGQLNRTLPREDGIIHEGVYTFKVSLEDTVWRKFKLSSLHTLLDLHNMIQRTFEFNDDHLYSFFMDGVAWSRNSISSPDDDSGPYVHEVTIGELRLKVNQRFLYLFDYGSEWHFTVELIHIQDGDELKEPKISGQKGEAPDQYSWW
ncbi:plasmid pRiA4b ORF-3 family protein [Bacillus sp. FJAT-47783]|uniref:plasmid pRiA4b ORF-3 family protein n=1 Tax=Bacillus sp. FJAT-47783 TaxID=2922712 RepID=UPI001FAB401B|nr:plasmid pRiA4b ORF-3 family protein [Bacillus sp. FJAT-47783]